MSEVPTEANDSPISSASGVAERLKAAREAAGLSLNDVAETTRVPLRHLAALEQGDFSALPGTTYVSGFTRAYARAVGLDEAAIVQEVREEIGEMGGLGHSAYEFEEAVNPARIPPRWLAWAAALIAVLLAGAYGLWRMQLMTPPTEDPTPIVNNAAIAERSDANAAGNNSAAPVATGPVIMTAADDVWIRIYQADGTRLYEGTLKRGESYTLPDNARDPMILTGRPDVLAITVGGQAIPPLGPAERTISDMPVSAAALLARSRQPMPPEDNGAAATGNAASPVASTPVQTRTAQRRRDATPAAGGSAEPAAPGEPVAGEGTASP